MTIQPRESTDNTSEAQPEYDDDVNLSKSNTFSVDMFTIGDDYTSTVKFKRNHILSLLPTSKNEVEDCSNKQWRATEESNKKAQTINSLSSTSFYYSPTTTSSTVTTSSTSSSSSTNQRSAHSGMSRHKFRVVNPSSIPDYANLRKYFSKFHSRSKKQKSDVLIKYLLPWLQKNVVRICLRSKEELEEVGFWGLKNVAKENKELQFGRSTLLKWWKALLSNMLIIEAEERSVYYDCILKIMSRFEFLDYDFIGSSTYAHWYKRNSVPHTTSIDDYRKLLITTLNYAIDKLNQKAIYSNMISFCATVLALSYFKIPGLASLLLQGLTIRPTVMKKLYKEMNKNNLNHRHPYKSNLQCVFPKSLHSLMISDFLSYQNYLTLAASQDSIAPVSLSGNWIRRWQSDDSELFFTFYRSYHNILIMYTSIVYPATTTYQLYQRNAILSILPGYMYLASFFACKIDSLIHQELNSVTTMANQGQQLNPSKTACLSPLVITTGNISVVNEAKLSTLNICDEYNYSPKAHHDTPLGKPKALTLATKRYAECLIRCIGAADSQGLYLDMLNVWVRFTIERTVLTEAREVYCMIDFLDQVVIELQRYFAKDDYLPIDIPFILYTLDIILSQSDHTTSLLRALAYIYTNFEFLTSHAALLDLLCNQIMLDTQNFERLLLHWGKNVRHFFIRCLMWRVGRVWQPAGVRWNFETEEMMQTIFGKNGNATTPIVCDRRSCWIEWEKMLKSNVAITTGDSMTTADELTAYQKCSLEIHISLEALMASLHKQHSSLQHKYMSLSNYSKLNTQMPTITQSVECTTPIPIRTRDFSSQLALSPAPAKVLNTICSSSMLKSLENNSSIIPVKTQITKINYNYKRYKVSPLAVKEHLVIKSRNSRERLLKLFNGSGIISTSATDNNCDFSVKNKGDDLDKEISHREYYTVQSFYSTTSPNSRAVKLMENKRCSLSDHQVANHDAMASSRNWRYRPSNHVYAVKVLSDLRPILNEYCVWMEQNRTRISNASLVYLPRLVLEWPKGWTFTQT